LEDHFMKKLLASCGVIALLAICALSQAAPTPTATPTPAPAPTPAPYDKLKVGDMAPDFTLPDLAGKPVKLSDFRGKNNVVLAFYVFAFTGG
jgi:cytochrome oxidase Cu insertion factor (SCO1/SenC/PrrC family)